MGIFCQMCAYIIHFWRIFLNFFGFSMIEMDQSHEQKHLELSSALEQKEEELRSLTDRMTEMQGKYEQTRTVLEEKDEELRSFRDSVTEMDQSHEQKHLELSSALEQKEEELRSLTDRMTEMQGKYEQTRTVLEEKDEELRSFRDSYNESDDLQYVRNYRPENERIGHLRVLLYGPVGSGKSSFINSVCSVLRGRMVVSALASATTSDRSFTIRYETFKIKKVRSLDTFYPVVFNDIMGLEDGKKCGVHPDDIKLAMKGHVRESYKFNPVSPLSERDSGYNPTPTANDKVHVLVCVHSGNSSEMKDSVLKKMKSVREMASNLGIPQILVVTKIDEACPEIEKDLKNVYESKYLKKKMEEFSAALAIQMNCIFPVKNYSNEINMKEDVDTLILRVLRKIVYFGDNFIEKM